MRTCAGVVILKLRNIQLFRFINIICGKCYVGSSSVATSNVLLRSELLKSLESAFTQVKEKKRERFEAVRSDLI